MTMFFVRLMLLAFLVRFFVIMVMRFVMIAMVLALLTVLFLVLFVLFTVLSHAGMPAVCVNTMAWFFIKFKFF